MQIYRRTVLETLFGIGVASIPFLRHTPARASDAADFYKGKTIRILVGSPPGGGYDLYARMLAPHFAKRLGATVIIENRDGNGGLLALNFLLARPADGLTLMHASAEAATLSQLLERDGSVWDVTKLHWLSKTSSAPKLWFVGKNSKIRSAQDAIAAERVVWSATGPADNISDVAAIISYAIGLKSKIVIGYKGAGDMSLAVVNGEVDAGVLSADSAYNGVKNGDLHPIAVFDSKRWPMLPNVPTLAEAAKIDPDKLWLVKLRQDIGEAQRAMVAAPGMPLDRIAYLRSVWADVLTDPEVIDEGARTKREINFMGGAELQDVISDLMKEAVPRLPEIKRVLLQSYF
jgi:tripartite-type tricarboxylate transporter receptor subunit TctC